MSASNDREMMLLSLLEKERGRINVLLRKNKALADNLAEGRTNRGRNAVKKSRLTSYGKVNLDQIATYLKWRLLPHVKFPLHNWWHYLPNEPRSLFSRIAREVEWPQDCHIKHYWEEHIVPLINKKFIDYRSNASEAMKEQSISELYVCLLIICICTTLIHNIILYYDCRRQDE